MKKNYFWPKKKNMRITYNSPYILSFTTLAVFVFIVSYSAGGNLAIFTLNGDFQFNNWQSYFGLFFYPLSHANLSHLVANFSVILLVGPLLEKQIGWKKLFWMSVITTLVIGIVHILLSNQGLIGASGLVFLYIILASLSNSSDKEIPLTFILVVLLFLGQEISNAFKDDNISQMAHIVGGLMAIVFRYIIKYK